MNRLFATRFCFGLLLISLLTSCDQIEQLIKQEAEPVVFLNGAFSVVKPASWLTMDDLNDEADLQMGNIFKEAYVIVLTESKQDFENIGLHEHSDLTRSGVKEVLKNYQESPPENFDIGGYPALRYQLSGSIDSLKIVYWHVTIETNDHFHQMLLWSLPSKFDGNKADFSAVIQSFKVL
ncbi:MAG: hypothetical protein AAF353_19195 [Pseudomonadota bacterium]